MNNPIIYWVVGGLLILFFFYLTYKFTETWRVWHVIFAFMVFGAAIALSVYISMTLRTHNAWRTLVGAQVQQVQDLEGERDEMLYGKLTEVLQSTPSIRSLAAELQRSIIDRGRVWRGCTPAQAANDDTVTVSTVPAGAGAVGGGAEPNHIEQNMILYVFLEADPPPETNLPPGTRLPFYYLGEFTSSAVTDTSVTLKPTFPLDREDKIALRSGGTWVIYETMPVDGHRFFTADAAEEPDLNRSADESPVFGTMDEAALQALMPPGWLLPPSQRNAPPPADVAQQLQQRNLVMLTPYVRDGKRASEDDPPDNAWWKVRFTKAHQEEVDTAGDPLGAIVSSEDFFDRGRAEVALLRRGEAAKFKKDDVGVFPQEDARRLIDEEQVCELIEPVYVRSLNDYDSGFRLIAETIGQLAKDIRQVQRDTTEVQQADALVLEQTRYRQTEGEKLKTDLEKTEYERDQITQYASDLEKKWAKTRAELSELYRANFALVEQLASLDRELTDEINRRTAEAVSDGS